MIIDLTPLENTGDWIKKKKKKKSCLLILKKRSQLDTLTFSPLIILGDFTVLADQKERVGLYRILNLFIKFSSRSVTYFKSWHGYISKSRISIVFLSLNKKAFLISLGHGNKS